MNKICLIGDILVDVTLKNRKEELKMRLGGIVHSARALWSISSTYSIGYISPKYLDSRINKYLSYMGDPSLVKVAETLNAPNLILIEEAREVGSQGYELVLRDQLKYEYFDFELPNCDNILITSGQYDISSVLNRAEGKSVSIELANMSFDTLLDLNFKFIQVCMNECSFNFRHASLSM